MLKVVQWKGFFLFFGWGNTLFCCAYNEWPDLASLRRSDALSVSTRRHGDSIQSVDSRDKRPAPRKLATPAAGQSWLQSIGIKSDNYKKGIQVFQIKKFVYWESESTSQIHTIFCPCVCVSTFVTSFSFSICLHYMMFQSIQTKYFPKACHLVMTMTETKIYKKTNTKTKTHRHRQRQIQSASKTQYLLYFS